MRVKTNKYALIMLVLLGGCNMSSKSKLNKRMLTSGISEQIQGVPQGYHTTQINGLNLNILPEFQSTLSRPYQLPNSYSYQPAPPNIVTSNQNQMNTVNINLSTLQNMGPVNPHVPNNINLSQYLQNPIQFPTQQQQIQQQLIKNQIIQQNLQLQLQRLNNRQNQFIPRQSTNQQLNFVVNGQQQNVYGLNSQNIQLNQFPVIQNGQVQYLTQQPTNQQPQQTFNSNLLLPILPTLEDLEDQQRHNLNLFMQQQNQQQLVQQRKLQHQKLQQQQNQQHQVQQIKLQQHQNQQLQFQHQKLQQQKHRKQQDQQHIQNKISQNNLTPVRQQAYPKRINNLNGVPKSQNQRGTVRLNTITTTNRNQVKNGTTNPECNRRNSKTPKLNYSNVTHNTMNKNWKPQNPKKKTNGESNKLMVNNNFPHNNINNYYKKDNRVKPNNHNTGKTRTNDNKLTNKGSTESHNNSNTILDTKPKPQQKINEVRISNKKNKKSNSQKKKQNEENKAAYYSMDTVADRNISNNEKEKEVRKKKLDDNKYKQKKEKRKQVLIKFVQKQKQKKKNKKKKKLTNNKLPSLPNWKRSPKQITHKDIKTKRELVLDKYFKDKTLRKILDEKDWQLSDKAIVQLSLSYDILQHNPSFLKNFDIRTTAYLAVINVIRIGKKSNKRLTPYESLKKHLPLEMFQSIGRKNCSEDELFFMNLVKELKERYKDKGRNE